MPLALRAVIALPLALSLALSLVACSEKPKRPEDQVRARLDEGVDALEANDLGRAGKLLHDDYRDPSGRDRRAMKALAFYLLRRGPVRMRLSDVQTQVAPDGKTATVRAKVLAVQGSGTLERLEDLAPQGARSVDVTLHLVNDDGDWLVTSIEGDGMGKPDF